MSDYIGRESAKKAHCKICFENSTCYRNPETCQDLKAFDRIPAADVREVVYCKDCVYSQAWYADKRICRLWNEEDGNSVFSDGFCNYGAKTYADALNCGADMRVTDNDVGNIDVPICTKASPASRGIYSKEET